LTRGLLTPSSRNSTGYELKRSASSRTNCLPSRMASSGIRCSRTW